MNNVIPLLQALQAAQQQGVQTPTYGAAPTLAQFAANSGMGVPRQMSPWANIPWMQVFANAMRQRGRPQPMPQAAPMQASVMPVQAQAQQAPAGWGGSGWNSGFAGPAAGASQAAKPRPQRVDGYGSAGYAPVQTFTPVGGAGALPTQAVAQPGVVSTGRRDHWGF
jgi:hypothetical protein